MFIVIINAAARGDNSFVVAMVQGHMTDDIDFV